MKVVGNFSRREVIKAKEDRNHLIRKMLVKNGVIFVDECYSNKGKQVKEGDAQMALGDSDDSDSYHVLLMVTTSNCTKSNSWYLDPRCSNHITGNRVVC